MTSPTRFRAPRLVRGLALDLKPFITRQRASVAAAVFGAVVGLGVGFAYLGGAVAQSAEVRGQANRMLGAYDSGFTEEALAAAVGGLDESALQVARRHDPYTVAGDAQRDRRAAQFSALLQQRGGSALTPTAAGVVEGAAPFRLNGALEDSRDLDCLTTAVYHEARGEGRAGMQAVAQVILNRARQVAASSLGGSVYAPVGNATHFHTTAVNPRWSGQLVRVGQIGSHIFYRFGGRRGAASQFAGSVDPSRSGGATLQAASVETAQVIEGTTTAALDPNEVPVVDMSAPASTTAETAVEAITPVA